MKAAVKKHLDEAFSSPLTGLQRRFLTAYELCGSLKRAAVIAAMDRGNHYRWMRDETYAAAFRESDARATQALEDHMHEIALGECTRMGPQQELTAGIFLLKGRSERYAEKSRIDHTTKGDRISIFSFGELVAKRRAELAAAGDDDETGTIPE